MGKGRPLGYGVMDALRAIGYWIWGIGIGKGAKIIQKVNFLNDLFA